MAALVCILWQCSSEDFNLAENNPKRNNSEFFKHASSGGLANRGGVDYVNILEDYNDKHDFLATMPDQQGMPIWDKMEVVDTETSSGLMIPLSYDDETLSSVLFAIIDEGNRVVGVKNFDNNLLKSIVYDKTIDHNFRERLFYTFMYVDNKVFGTTRFTGISTDLFANQKYNNTFGRIEIKNFELSQNVTTNESGKILWVESCYLYPKCSHHGGDNVQCDGCIELCHASSCSTAMVYVETGDYYPPAIPSGGGGGGGPSGCNLCPDYNPPKDDCAMQEVFYRMKPECSGGTGDSGELPLEDPCKKIKAVVNNVQLKPKIDSLKAFSQTAIDDEKGYIQDKSGNVHPAQVNGKHHVDFIIDQNSLGGIHNHTLNGIHMFSPRDIMSLVNIARVQNYTLPVGSTADNTGNAFLGMISQSGSYFITFNGGGGDLPLPMTHAEEMALEIKLNAEYKKIIVKLLKAEGKDKSDDLSEQGLQKLFFSILKEMGLEGKVNLIKENNGSTSVIEQNSDGTIKTPTPC